MPKIITLATFIPPPVLPPQAPIMVKMNIIACENSGHLSKSLEIRPVVDEIDVTWKKECFKASPKFANILSATIIRFIAIAKVPFDALEDNPATWDIEKDGKPYVYVMIRGVKNVAELDRLKKQNALVGLDAVQSKLRTFKIFENAEKFRREVYNKLKIYGYKKRLEIIKNL